MFPGETETCCHEQCAGMTPGTTQHKCEEDSCSNTIHHICTDTLVGAPEMRYICSAKCMAILLPSSATVDGDDQSWEASLSMYLKGTVCIRVGEPLGSKRGGTTSEIEFRLDEGLSTLKGKIERKFADELQRVKTANEAMLLRTTSDVYFKKAKNDSQQKYVLLTEDNFSSVVSRRHALISDKERLDSFRFRFFIYVERTAELKNLHRATASRLEVSRVKRAAYESARGIRLGPIAAAHCDVVNARRNEDNYFVNTDATTLQASALDASIEATRREDADAMAASLRIAQFRIKLNGTWVPVEFEVKGLRTALGLPEHDIFTQGIYQEFRPVEPSNGHLADLDHVEI
jgi:hypothetical protein